MRTRLVASLALCLSPAVLRAQPSKTAPAPATQQIAAAVLALPKEFRADARVLGYAGSSHELTMIRQGKGPFTCLANDPATKEFHVACYHESLEPFMARGRALRASGVKGDQVDTVRFAEVRTGKLAMPKQATLYQLFGPAGSFDAAHGTAKKAKPLIVVYIPGATVASSGLSAQPADGLPWIMFPGTPKAHIMLEPKM
ncbi:MAG TPA: hypothetical protein VGP25_05745 [Gemmatimonadaceae bacterium]|nr:hypothetical protein [Gemmatimonadaceae bacterium]